ncbi:hypothetical protein [Anthocerotibacter panamensis]|uniref:hypothetical protein n=1 Tax=Anthocerotibacter panamensis TaxID=2857077 RepID=UPI001C406D5F|nr:hypothetical protein [Anthocerotibacter panamensis]
MMYVEEALALIDTLLGQASLWGTPLIRSSTHSGTSNKGVGAFHKPVRLAGQPDFLACQEGIMELGENVQQEVRPHHYHW